MEKPVFDLSLLFLCKKRTSLRPLFSALSIPLIVFQLSLPCNASCTEKSEPHSPAPASIEQPGTGRNTFTASMQGFFTDVCQYFRTSYRWGGQNPGGFDCSGFVRFMYDKVFNMQLPRTAREMAAIGNKVQRQELKPGDLVFFQTRGKGINHVGIFIGADTFIHSSLTRGITEDQLKDNYYDKSFVGGVRLLDTGENKPFPSGHQPKAMGKEKNS